MRFRLGFGCATLHCGHRCAMRSAPASVPLPLADAQTEARQQSEKLTAKIGQPFEHDDRLAELARRQDEIIKQLDLTRNQASSQMDSSETQTETQQTSDATNSLRRATMRRATIRV